jgi:hypothetical protein
MNEWDPLTLVGSDDVVSSAQPRRLRKAPAHAARVRRACYNPRGQANEIVKANQILNSEADDQDWWPQDQRQP